VVPDAVESPRGVEGLEAGEPPSRDPDVSMDDEGEEPSGEGGGGAEDNGREEEGEGPGEEEEASSEHSSVDEEDGEENSDRDENDDLIPGATAPEAREANAIFRQINNLPPSYHELHEQKKKADWEELLRKVYCPGTGGGASSSSSSGGSSSSSSGGPVAVAPQEPPLPPRAQDTQDCLTTEPSSSEEEDVEESDAEASEPQASEPAEAAQPQAQAQEAEEEPEAPLGVKHGRLGFLQGARSCFVHVVHAGGGMVLGDDGNRYTIACRRALRRGKYIDRLPRLTGDQEMCPDCQDYL
jgi:hypothetical protein